MVPMESLGFRVLGCMDWVGDFAPDVLCVSGTNRTVTGAAQFRQWIHVLAIATSHFFYRTTWFFLFRTWSAKPNTIIEWWFTSFS